MFLEGLIVLIIGIAIIVAICRVVMLLFTLSVAFSKITVSLVVALICHSQMALAANGLLSFGIWAAICMAVCFLVCKLPRVNCAFEFFSKTMVTYVVAFMVVNLVCTSILKIDLNTTWTLVTEFGMKLAVLVVAGISLRDTFEATDMDKFTNPIVVNADRVVASILYALSGMVLVFGNLKVSLPAWLDELALVAMLVIAFLVDFFYLSKKK